MAEERIRRRLAAILAADVVGYSRLVAADKAGTLAALRADLVVAYQQTNRPENR
jgi:class 3 adenylate cyclase